MKKMSNNNNNMSFQSPMDHSYHYVDEDDELSNSFTAVPTTTTAAATTMTMTNKPGTSTSKLHTSTYQQQQHQQQQPQMMMAMNSSTGMPSSLHTLYGGSSQQPQSNSNINNNNNSTILYQQQQQQKQFQPMTTTTGSHHGLASSKTMHQGIHPSSIGSNQQHYQPSPQLQQQQQQQLQQQLQQQNQLDTSQLSDRSFQQQASPDLNTYSERIKQLTAFSHTKTQLAEQLQQDLKSARMENDRLQQEIELLKRECAVKQQLQMELEKQSRVEDALRREMSELKEDHNRKTSELIEIQSVQDELLKVIAENKLKLEEQADKSKSTENDLSQLTKERDRLELLVSSMENERKNYEKNLMDQRRDLTEIMEQREKESQEQIEDLTEKVEHYTELSARLEDELSDARREISYLKEISGRAQSMEQQVSELSSRCFALESEKDILLTSERGYHDTISQLEESLSSQKTLNRKLEAQLDNLKKEVETKAQHITNMKAQINQISDARAQEKNHNELHVQSLLKILQSLKVEIGKKDELIASQKLNEPMLIPTRQDTTEIDKLKREIASCQEVIATLKNANSKLEESLDKDHKIITMLETKLNKVKEDRNILAEIVSNMKNNSNNKLN